MKKELLRGIADAADAIVAVSTVSPAQADVDRWINEGLANMGLVEVATGRYRAATAVY